MKFKSLGYCISQGFKNIGRNRVFSLASVATMSRYDRAFYIRRGGVG